MAELSDKFGALMARMAKTDAALFRTIGDHNKAVIEQVMDSEAALRGRFQSCKAAFEWIEDQLGPPPNKKKSWSIAVQVVTAGRWQVQSTTSKAAAIKHSQISSSLDQINQRLDGIESVLMVILKALQE